MQLMLPIPDSEKQALMGRAARALALGRLHAVREQHGSDGSCVVSAKFTDSFGFVDHPRLTTAQPQGTLTDFRCDCPEFFRTHRFCVHCAALADAAFELTGASDDQAEVSNAEPSSVSPVPLAPPPVEQLSYAFCNSRADLYPGKLNPRIPLVRYQQMFGDNAKARRLFSYKRSWGGSCFGITTSASMFFVPDDPVNVPDFKVGAVYPADLALTSRSRQMHMTLHTFIEGMHILQLGSELIYRPRSRQMENPNCLDELCQRVLHFQQTGCDPVGMAIWRTPGYAGGHSIFPYWLEISPDNRDRLYIYDPNHPMETRYAYLEKDENGHYISWRFPMNDYSEYSSAAGGQLAFDAYADYKQAWDQRGGSQEDATLSLPRCAAIASADGDILFRVTKDGSEAFCDDICQILLTDMGDESDEQVLLSLPAGHYVVRNEDPDRQELQVMLSHVRQSITVTTNAGEVELTADDASMTVSARVAQAGRSYTIELDANYEDDSRIILLEGVTAEGGLTFGCFSGVLRARGALTDRLATLYIDEELADLSCIEPLTLVLPSRDPIPEKKPSPILNDSPSRDDSAPEGTN